MALSGKFSIILYIILFSIMIEKSTCVYELTRDIRSPKPILHGLLFICTEEHMKRKISICVLCKGPDLSCFSSSSSTTPSTTTSTTTPSTSTTSTSTTTKPVVTSSSTTTKEPAGE